jgi:predicted enzyme related to lactoylglutathione lyase
MSSPVVHFEIGCRDPARTSAFYAELFGWKGEPYGPAVMFAKTGEGGIGGHVNSLSHEPHTYITIYAQVDNLPAHLDKAARLGGRTIVPRRRSRGGASSLGWPTPKAT